MPHDHQHSPAQLASGDDSNERAPTHSAALVHSTVVQTRGSADLDMHSNRPLDKVLWKGYSLVFLLNGHPSRHAAGCTCTAQHFLLPGLKSLRQATLIRPFSDHLKVDAWQQHSGMGLASSSYACQDASHTSTTSFFIARCSHKPASHLLQLSTASSLPRARHPWAQSSIAAAQSTTSFFIAIWAAAAVQP